MDITQAIYDKLTGDATLVGLIANYPSGSPGNPAVFTGWPVPPDAARPYVFSRGEVDASLGEGEALFVVAEPGAGDALHHRGEGAPQQVCACA